MTERGKYIVIEGHDGTGKSSQVELLRDNLAEVGIDSVEFHEPDGTPIASEIRKIIKNGTLERDGVTNLFLFNAARHDIWYSLARPALAMGKWVVASRNYYSTLAYQGYGEGIDKDLIVDLTRAATDEQYMTPDLAMVLSLDDEQERLSRINSRGELENPDTFESKDGGFQDRVRLAYPEIASKYGATVLSAAKSKCDIADDIWALTCFSLDVK